MTADHHGLPPPRTTLAASYVAVLVWCKSCRHQAQADMQKIRLFLRYWGESR
jgi:hypothetical protein